MKRFHQVQESLKKTNVTMLAVSLWSLAAVAVGGVTLEARSAFTALREHKDLSVQKDQAVVSVEKIILTPPEYARVKEMMEAGEKVTGVLLEVKPEGLQISVQKVEEFTKFRDVIYDIMASARNVRWEAVNMCAGKECGTPAFSALLRGYRLTVQTKSLLTNGGRKG